MYKSGYSLAKIKGFTEKHISKLAGYGISTAEEMVSLASSFDGKKALTQILNIDADELSSLLDKARECLPKRIREEMETPVDTTNFGLGALEPEPESDDQPESK